MTSEKDSNEKILVVDDEVDVLESIVQLLKNAGYKCLSAFSTSEAVEVYKQKRPLVVLTDLQMEHELAGFDVLERIREIDSEAVVLVYTGYANVQRAVVAIQKGAFDFIPKVSTHHDIILPIARAFKYARLKKENDILKRQLNMDDGSGFLHAVGNSPAILQVFEKAKKVARTNATVLITGEGGTGKEIIAKGIHHYSPRSSNLFVPVVLGTLPETLMESELFGHVKGSYTGAVADKAGLFEAAEGGTIFLDEVTEVEPDLQQKLLRVLQERVIRRVGSVKEIPVDVRIISATNKDPEKLVREGKLREDLFYRLNVVRLHVPALRERKEDIPLLAYHFLKTFKDTGIVEVTKISNDALMLMQEYDWPGNVRQLAACIEQSVAFADKPEITPDILPEYLRPKAKPVYIDPAVGYSFKEAKERVLQRFEKSYIESLLEKHKYNVSKVALEAEINRKTVYRIAELRGIDLRANKSEGSEATTAA